MLDPIDLRSHSHVEPGLKSLGPPPERQDVDEEADLSLNDAILDELIMNFNMDHLQEQLRTESNRGMGYSGSVGSKYVLQRILGHPEIDSYEKQESRVHLAAIIEDNKAQSHTPAYDHRDQMSINKHFSRWFEADHCWMCNNFRYFIPIVLDSEIQAEGEGSRQLTSAQERELKRLLVQNNQNPPELQ